MGWYMDYIRAKMERENEETYLELERQKALERITAEPGSVMYHDYMFKIKVEADRDGNYRIYLKAPDLMNLYVDITEQCTSDFQQKLFADFFKKEAA